MLEGSCLNLPENRASHTLHRSQMETAMEPELRVVPATTFLLSAHQTTVPQIPVVAETAVPALYQEAHRAGLEVCGDLVFIYRGMCGPHDEFTLEIALPVTATGNVAEPFAVRQNPEFPCMAVDYVGAMTGIGAAWDTLMTAFRDRGLQHAGEGREIYRHWVAFDSPENITELQQGYVS